MQVVALALGNLSTNCYIVHNENGTFVIDPACDAHKILSAVTENGWQVDAVVFTHGHYDHIGAADELGVERVYVHAEDEKLYRQPEFNLSVHFGARFSGAKECVLLKDGDAFMGFTVLHTPGHTPGGICLYNKEENALFSGDTLFCRGYGRTDFPGGSMLKLRESLLKLLELPEETRVFPGHGSDTTIAQERRNLGWKGSR